MRMISKRAERLFGMLEQYAGSTEIVDDVMKRLGRADLTTVMAEIDKERVARQSRTRSVSENTLPPSDFKPHP